MLGAQFINAQLVVSTCFHHDNFLQENINIWEFPITSGMALISSRVEW
jgi:hypothetical protein